MKNIILLLIFIFSAYLSYSQGCSDAGICSLDLMKENDSSFHKKNLEHNLKFGLGYGLGQSNVSVESGMIEYGIAYKKTTLQSKITYALHQGSIGNSKGFGDFFINLGQQLYKNKRISLLVFCGVKIPLSDANSKHEGQDLPMAYQTSLGSYDALFGFHSSLQNISLQLMTQIPFAHNNENNFLSSNTSKPEATKHPDSKELIRSPDIVLRTGYIFRSKEKLSIEPSILAIYHLKNDKITNIDGTKTEVQGSKGTTINMTSEFGYKLSPSKKIIVQLGFPVLAREKAPDGLVRTFVLNFSFLLTL